MLGSVFLTAEWRHLLLLNFEVPAALLEPLVPTGTELDRWQGRALVSLVGFLFRDTRVLGVPIPGHRNFEEINLRFYVARRTPAGELRRGVVFLRELVPRAMIAWTARVVYGEPYRRAPTDHRIDLDAQCLGRVSYRWGRGSSQCELTGSIAEEPTPPAHGSEAEFITEHYWGYSRQVGESTKEYRVAHSTWASSPVTGARLVGDSSSWYGDRLAPLLSAEPISAFYAVGSKVSVYAGVAL